MAGFLLQLYGILKPGRAPIGTLKKTKRRPKIVFVVENRKATAEKWGNKGMERIGLGLELFVDRSIPREHQTSGFVCHFPHFPPIFPPFSPFFHHVSHFSAISPIFLPFPPFFRHFPHFSTISPIFPLFPPFSPFSPFFRALEMCPRQPGNPGAGNSGCLIYADGDMPHCPKVVDHPSTPPPPGRA